jgi:hypothetical protein
LYLLISIILKLSLHYQLPNISVTLPVTIIAVFLGALAKLYQKGSARLGVVDLFSCEMTTICRVVLVTEATSGMIDLYINIPDQPASFDSNEDYSPVFDSNVKELEVLEARAVERVTEFYTVS